MPTKILLEIEEIPYPPQYIENFKKIIPLAEAAIRHSDFIKEENRINIGKVSEDLEPALFFFYWIGSANDVIGNLNMTISDLRKLPFTHAILGGSPLARFELVTNTYFHEFYRLREQFKIAVKGASNRGYIEVSEVPKLRKSFHDAFSFTIALRNKIVHDEVTWKGKDYVDLTLASDAWERDMALHFPKTGKTLHIYDALEANCRPVADALRDEGIRMSKILQAVIQSIVFRSLAHSSQKTSDPN